MNCRYIKSKKNVIENKDHTCRWSSGRARNFWAASLVSSTSVASGCSSCNSVLFCSNHNMNPVLGLWLAGESSVGVVFFMLNSVGCLVVLALALTFSLALKGLLLATAAFSLVASNIAIPRGDADTSDFLANGFFLVWLNGRIVLFSTLDEIEALCCWCCFAWRIGLS